ncbi:MAG: uroporphyrinogen decarboxylase family protein, partial [Anaerolineae bacterium]
VRRDRRDGLSMPEWLDYPVHTPDDWLKLKRERLDPAAPGRVTQDWDAFRAQVARTGEAVQVGVYPWGMFGSVRDLMGVERLLESFYDEPEMVYDIMEHLTTLWLSLYERAAREVQIDHIHIWEDMSGKQGSLISPAMVERFMMPQYDRIAAFARAHGVQLISVDTDGDCRELVPIMTRHGVNVFLPFEVQAGNDVRAYRASYPELGIIGGIDKRCLETNLTAVDAELVKVRGMVRLGRYVPSYDHLIPPDARWENVVYAAREIKRICYGN